MRLSDEPADAHLGVPLSCRLHQGIGGRMPAVADETARGSAYVVSPVSGEAGRVARSAVAVSEIGQAGRTRVDQPARGLDWGGPDERQDNFTGQTVRVRASYYAVRAANARSAAHASVCWPRYRISSRASPRCPAADNHL